MENKIPSYLLSNENKNASFSGNGKSSLTFIDRTLRNTANTVKLIYQQAENATKDSLIQRIDVRVKLFALLWFAVIISIVNNIAAQAIITAFILLIMLFSGIKVFSIYKKAFVFSFIFGFLLMAPASLNIFSKGNIIFNIISFNKLIHFFNYNIPQKIGITYEGIRIVMLIFLRVFNSVSIALSIVSTTSFPELMKSLRIIKVPGTFIMIITLAYKFIFILSKNIEETYFAIKSRLIGNIKNKNIRKLISGRIFYIFRKGKNNYENTYMAMVSRGYAGKIFLNSKKHFETKDIVALIIIVAFGIGILFI